MKTNRFKITTEFINWNFYAELTDRKAAKRMTGTRCLTTLLRIGTEISSEK